MTVSTGGPPTAAAAAAAGAAEPGAWTAAKAGAHRPRVSPAGSKAAERRGHFMAATPLPGVGEICRSSCLPAWLMCNERMRVARACATHTHVWTDRRAEDLLGGATIVANLWRFARHVWSNFDNPGAERRRLGQDAPGRRPPRRRAEGQPPPSSRKEPAGLKLRWRGNQRPFPRRGPALRVQAASGRRRRRFPPWELPWVRVFVLCYNNIREACVGPGRPLELAAVPEAGRQSGSARQVQRLRPAGRIKYASRTMGNL